MYGWPAWNNPYFVPGQRGLLNNVRQMVPMQNPQQLYMGQYHQGLEHQVFPNAFLPVVQHQMHDISHSLSPHHHFPYAQRNNSQNWQKNSSDRTTVTPAQNSAPVTSSENEVGKKTQREDANSDQSKPEMSSNEALNAVNIAESATKEMAPKNLQEEEKLNFLKEQAKNWQQQKQFQEEQQKQVQEQFNQSVLMYNQAVTQASFVQPSVQLMQQPVQQNAVPHQQVAAANVLAYGDSKMMQASVTTQRNVQPAVPTSTLANVNKSSNANAKPFNLETSNIDHSPQQKLTTSKENVAEIQSNQSAGNSELSVLVKCLRDFEEHLRQWNEQFDEWRRQNKDHSDRQKYLTYEKQWLDWRGQLVQRHLQMKELYHEQNSKLNQQSRWKPLADTKVENDFIVCQKHQMASLRREQQFDEADNAFDNISFRGREVIRSTEESFMPSRSSDLGEKSLKDYSSTSGNLYNKNITASKDDEKNKFGKSEIKERLIKKWATVEDFENKESEMMELARLSGYVEEEIVSAKVTSELVNIKSPSESVILQTLQPKINEKTPIKSQNKDSLLVANKDASELYDPFEEDFTVDVKKSNKVGAVWLNSSVDGLLEELAQPSVELKEVKNQSAKGVRSALLQTPVKNPFMNEENSNFQSIEKQEGNDDFNDRVWKFDDDCYVFFDDKSDALANNAPELFQRRDTDSQEISLIYEKLNRNVSTRNVDQVQNAKLAKDNEQQERKNNPAKRIRVSRFDQPIQDTELRSDQVMPHVERFERQNQILEPKSDQLMPIAERFDRPNQILEPRVDNVLPNLTRFDQSNQILEPRFNQMVPSHFDQANKLIESRFDKAKVSRFDHPVELRSEISKESIRNTERFTRRTDVPSRTEPFNEGPRHISESRGNVNKWVPVPFADEVRPNVEYNKCDPITEAYSKGDSSDNSLSNIMPTIPITVGGSIARTLTFEEQEIIRQATEELKALQDLKELTKMLNTNVVPCSIPTTPSTSSGTNWKAPIDYDCGGEAEIGVRKSNVPFELSSREPSFCNRRFSTEISLSSRKVFDYEHKTITDPDQKQTAGKPFRLARLKSLDYAHGQVLKPIVELNDKPFEDPSRCVLPSTTVSFPGAQANTDVRQTERSYDISHTSKERTTPRWEQVKEQPITRSTRNESFQNKRSREAPFKSGAVIIGDLIGVEGRRSRPPRIVIILRGPPGSSKSYVAKLIKDKEIENGGSAPRILSLDDYFMVETEKKAIDPETGKSIKIKVMEYEYEPEVEESYRKSLLRAFKKTIDDGFFPLIIVDAINNRVKHFDELHTYAKQKGFQVYICEMDMDPVVCFKRNIHNRTEEEITRMIKTWEDTPRLCLQLDVRSLLQDASITEVEMEDFVETKVVDQGVIKKGKAEASKTDKIKEDSPDLEVITPSKWEQMDATTERLDKLDGFLKAKRKLETPKSLEHYLQVSDDYEEREVQPGKKRVRWADIEEGKNLAKRRELGFVVGQTNWSHFTDPDYAQKALTRTKYI